MEPCQLSDPTLHVLSLRYSSWSIRPWLALTAAGAPFSVETIEFEDMGIQTNATGAAIIEESTERLARRRGQGSVTGLFPVLTRFRTYDVELPSALESYAGRVESHPTVDAWRRAAAAAPAIAIYDEMIRAKGGDPEAAARD